jgi:hypothetical protein
MLGSDGGCHAIPKLGLWGPEVDFGFSMLDFEFFTQNSTLNIHHCGLPPAARSLTSTWRFFRFDWRA